MSIRKQLEADMRQAMRARDQQRLSCIRMLKSKLQEREVALRGKHGKDHELADDEVLAVVSAYAKQRRDSIDSYRQGGRDDLADAEQAELEIVTAYLPKQLSAGELRELVRGAIAESGAASMKDIGAVMKVVMLKTKGLADGKQVNLVARELLSADG